MNVTTMATGGHYFEGPRWHGGRWWVSDIYARAVCSYDLAGERTVVHRVEHRPSGLGWLPDGTMLVVSMEDRKLLRDGPGGLVEHADLAGFTEHAINDLVVDSAGRAWTGSIGFAISDGEPPQPAALYRVDPDGSISIAAEDLWCPNGLVITADGSTLIVAESFAGRLTAFTIGADGTLTDRRVFAQIGDPPTPGPTPDMLAALAIVPDGCAIDAQDHVWAADAAHHRCVRISPSGSIVDEVTVPEDRNVYACALGGPDEHTLLLCTAPDFFAAAHGDGAGSAELLVTTVDVPGAAR